MQIKVLSWNIWCGTYFDEVVSFLEKEQPDIIALQEVSEEEAGNIAMHIAQALGYECTYSLSMDMPVRFLKNPPLGKESIKFGNAILSKHKIVGTKVFELTPQEGNRPVVQADIKIGGEVVQVFSLHLKHTHQQPSELQNSQADELIKLISDAKAIVMGDFNCLPGSYPIKEIGKIMNNTDVTNSSPTWCKYIEGCIECKIDEIKYKLDYIFASKDLKFDSFKVEDSAGSDHLPISVIIEI